MQSCALQHCLLSLGFQSTNQIIFWHFQGLLLLQAQLLTFWVSTIFQFLSLSPGPFQLPPFHFLTLLHQLIWKYRLLSPLALFCQLQLCLAFLSLSCCHTEYWYPATLLLFHFLLLLLGRVNTSFPCVLTQSCYKGPSGLSLLHVVSSFIFFLIHFITPIY